MSNSLNLLHLPPELRNKIYELVLTSDTTLHLQTVATEYKRRGALYALSYPNGLLLEPAEFNQLKYVNKKLYSEVAHLELRFNEIAVIADPRSGIPGPAALFLGWHATLSSSKQAWIRKVTLEYQEGAFAPDSNRPFRAEPARTFHTLACICRANTHMTVRYTWPTWNTFHNILRTGTELTCMFRGYSAFIELLDFSIGMPLRRIEVAPVERHAWRWQREFNAKDLQADNFRIYPQEPWDPKDCAMDTVTHCHKIWTEEGI